MDLYDSFESPITFLHTDVLFYIFQFIERFDTIEIIKLLHVSHHFYDVIQKYAINVGFHTWVSFTNEYKTSYRFYRRPHNLNFDHFEPEFIEWLCDCNYIELNYRKYCCNVISCKGNLDILLRLSNYTLTESMCISAARGGHLHIIKYAQTMFNENNSFWKTVDICEEAARYGHLDIIKYAHENSCPWNEETCSSAAFGGYLDILKYAHDNECPWNEKTCSSAAIKGHLDILKYVRENGCPWNEDTCSNAAIGGHLDILKYCYENGCPWDENTFIDAVRANRLDIIKYAYENGCKWSDNTSYKATMYYPVNMDILYYIIENGCPFDHEFCIEAARWGGSEFYNYLYMKGCSYEGHKNIK